MGAEGEVIDAGALSAQVEDTDLLVDEVVDQRMDQSAVSKKNAQIWGELPWGRAHHGCT